MARVRPKWSRAIETAAPIALAVFAAATMTDRVVLPVLIGIAGLLVGVAAVIVAFTTGDGKMTTFAVVSGSAAALWLDYAHTHSPWTSTALTEFALGTLLLTVWGAISYAKHLARLDAELAAEERARNAAELRKWTELLAGVNIKGCYATRVVTTRAGHVITYKLPADGSTTLRSLKDVTERIEIAGLPGGVKLQPGWVRFARGTHAGEVTMHVKEREVMKDAIPYPMDLSPLTINEPFDIGWSEDGSLCMIFFREIRLLIIGETGAGKSNLLNVIIAQLSRCVDVIIFGIDLKGGALLAPWLKPWINKQCNRPVIDWPACDRSEAERVMQALVNLIQARSRGFAGKVAKLRPGKGQETYVLLCDELAEIFATDEPKSYRDKHHAGEPTPSALAWIGQRITNTGRGAAVDPIWAAQRSTTSHIPSSIKSQCRLRIGLGVSTIGEASNLAPDDPAMQKLMSLAQYPGAGVVSRKDHQATATKFYQLEDPALIAKIAVHVGDHIRPEPSPFDRAALGDDYATRWERMSELLGAWSDLQPEQPSDGAFETIVAQLPAQEGLRPWQIKTLEIIGESGTIGLRPGMIVTQLEKAGLAVDRATVQRWLRTQANEGFVENLSHGRWRIARLDHRTGTEG